MSLSHPDGREQSFMQIKGTVKLTFDGMTHMTATGSIDTAFNGKVIHSDTQTDYRWKGSACSPNDASLRQDKAH
jgi:hypothetical protein